MACGSVPWGAAAAMAAAWPPAPITLRIVGDEVCCLPSRGRSGLSLYVLDQVPPGEGMGGTCPVLTTDMECACMVPFVTGAATVTGTCPTAPGPK